MTYGVLFIALVIEIVIVINNNSATYREELDWSG